MLLKNLVSAYGQVHEIWVLRPNKEISVFRVTGLKILGRVGTPFFPTDIPFKMHKIIYFPENLKKF